MKSRSLWLRGLSVACAFGFVASLAVFSTGCMVKMRTAGCSKTAAGCKGKCSTPCKKADGTAKCGKDCTKPCCAKKDKTVSDAAAPCHGSTTAVATASAKKGGCSKDCGSKKGGCGSKKTAAVADASAPCHDSKTTVATAAAKKGGCSKGCGSKKGGCGSKKTKLANCGKDCKKPCCAKNNDTAKSAAGR